MLQTDLYLVIGVVLCGLAIPSILGALADHRSPRVAAVVVTVGTLLVLVAYSQKPGFYDLHQVANAFVRVVAHYTR